jgi:hypothetical protein
VKLTECVVKYIESNEWSEGQLFFSLKGCVALVVIEVDSKLLGHGFVLVSHPVSLQTGMRWLPD